MVAKVMKKKEIVKCTTVAWTHVCGGKAGHAGKRGDDYKSPIWKVDARGQKVNETKSQWTHHFIKYI